jgi:CHAT domain-containing protein
LIDVKGREAELASVSSDIANLSTEYQQARNLLLSNNSNYASLAEPKTLSVRETQALLDSDTLLLEYRLAMENSYLWVLSADGFAMHVLPTRASITAQARQVYDSLIARNLHPAGETAPQRAARVSQADAQFSEASKALSQVLLGPVATMLGKKRLVIINDGILQYLPFGALPVPANSASKKTDTPLITDHEIVNLPSASVLSVIRTKTLSRRPPSKAVAVFADPVYNSEDPRIKAATKPIEASGSENSDPAISALRKEAPAQRFVRLRFSREEAENIMSLASSSSSLRALDFTASKRTALQTDLSQYKILHFATHGLLDTQHPEMSGLALSLRDESGQSVDGFLRLRDIYKLKLNADLVVLSGCQTALGKDLKAEGLIGLTRGFMYAGAPRVVASLWNVDDKATSELMKRFYHGVLVQGLRPANALRAAQKSLANETGWSAPYYWAAFTLQGDWK